MLRNWLTKLQTGFGNLTRRNKRRRRPTGRSVLSRTRSRYVSMTSERLEDRTMLTTTLFLDFGLGNIATTVAAFRDVDGANTGTNMTNGTNANPTGMQAGSNLNFAPLQYDFDLSGAIDINDTIALQQEVVALAQRELEPFDIDVRVTTATNTADISNFLRQNDGPGGVFFDGFGENDAYNMIAVVTSNDPQTGPGGSVGNTYGLFGRASGTDLNNGGAGNLLDEATITFADNVFGSVSGTPGTAAFNDNLAKRIAYTAVHEAAHTWTLIHTDGSDVSANERLLTRGDGIRLGSDTRESPNIFHRFDLELQNNPGVRANNYEVLRDDADIGLRDSDRDAVPDLAYVTGTGAHDIITLTDLGTGSVQVNVQAFSDNARTSLIRSDTYTIDLLGDTEGVILIDGGVGDDLIQVDARIDAQIRVRGGEEDPAGGGGNPNADDDTLQVFGTGTENVTYTPRSQTTDEGTVDVSGGALITFTELEPVIVNGVLNLNFVTPGSTDDVTIDSPAAGQNRITGTSDGIAFETVTFFDVTNVLVDTATNDAAGPDDTVTIEDTLVASGLATFRVESGDGDDLLTIDTSDGLNAPTISFDGGTGFDRLDLIQTGGVTHTSGEFVVGAAPGSGQVNVTGATTQTVNFENLEPVTSNLPVNAFSVTSNPAIASLLDGDNAINYTAGQLLGSSGRVTVDNFEPFEFTNVGELIIDAGAGSDTINLNNPNAPTGLTDITVNGNDPTAGSDTVVVNGTTGLDIFDVEITATDSATIAIDTLPDVTVDTVEHLVINGQGGNDTLNYAGISTGDNRIVLTPGNAPDAGTLEGYNSFDDESHLALQFTELGSFADLDIDSNSGFGFDALVVRGTDGTDVVAVDGALGDIFLETANAGPHLFITTNQFADLIIETLAGDDTIDLEGAQTFYDSVTVRGGDPSVDGDVLRLLADDADDIDIDPDFTNPSIVDIDGYGNDIDVQGIERIEVFGDGTASLTVSPGEGDHTASIVDSPTEGNLVNTDSLPTILFDDLDTFEFDADGTGTVDVSVNVGDLDGAVTYVIDIEDQDSLTIDGSSLDDSLRLFINGGGQLELERLTGTGDFPDAFLIDILAGEPDTINVRGLGGNDLLTVDNTGGAITVPIHFDGGNPVGELQQPVGDILNILTDGAAFTFLPGPESDSGTVSVTGSAPVSFDEVELLQIEGVNHILPDRFDDPDLIFVGNDSIDTATNLGSEPTVIEQRLTLHDTGTGINEDFFKITAHDTGEMIVNVFFADAQGDINIEIQDMSGDVVFASNGNLAQGLSTDDNEQVIIPVVNQEMYFLRVFSADGSPNIYNLEIETFAAPVPNTVHLDPASDTGWFNNDHVTADTTPRFIIQADLQDFADMGIDILNSTEAETNLVTPNTFPGAAVEVHIISGTTGVDITGFADPIGVSNILFEFTPDVPLPDDVYFVSAAVRIFDGQTPGEDGRTQLSDPLWFTIDAGAPKGMVLETFRSDLTGGQEVPAPVDTFAGGDALLRLNPAGDRLEMVIELAGLDLDGNQTPNNPNDDVTALHIHRGAAGVNGPVVFGLIGPNSDLNGDLVIDAVSGRISSAWDLNEGNGTTLAAELANLRNGDLYFNVHTVGNVAGEIRGQIGAAGGAIQMLESSDTGMSVIDGVTNIQSPAFVFKAEAGAKARIFARNTLTGTVNLVGTGFVGGDNSDGVADNGFGIGEITIEPIADGSYEIFADFEDVAGNVTSGYDFAVINTPTPLVDAGFTQAMFDVQGLFGNITDLDIKLSLTHPDLSELDFTIQAPDGTVVNSGAIFTGANFVNTVFDDDAATNIAAGVAPYTGSFNFGGVLDAAFDGIDPNGTWILTVTDSAAGNVGEITDLRLCITTDGGLPIEIDTLAPNTAFLDLAEASDTGRHNDDNVTNDNTPDVTITTTDPNQQFHTLYTDNLKFRIYDRLEGGEEFLLYDSALDGPVDAISTNGDSFTSLQFILETLPEQYAALIGTNTSVLAGGVLADGIHNFKLEVEDRAGNISQDFLNNVLIDTAAPAAPTIVIDAADSDTGVPGYPATLVDRVTSDTTAGFVGNAEANSIVRVAANANSLGLTLSTPINGDEAFPNGEWEIDPNLDYNDPVFGVRDGLRMIRATAEDLAGNVSLEGELDIFIDTQGPQVYDPDGGGPQQAIQVVTNGTPNATFDLFEIKPSSGPTPRVDGLLINIQDLPNRIAAFLYEALQTGVPNYAENPAHYQVIGDRVGIVTPSNVNVTIIPPVAGQPATATVELTFPAPLEDDRYTLRILPTLVDPVGNGFDGNADGIPGDEFATRFTVDSRVELGVHGQVGISIDANGNLVLDPTQSGQTDIDLTRDLTFQFGEQTDAVFAGQFNPQGIVSNGYDRLGAYGLINFQYRFLLDFNDNGAVDAGETIVSNVQVNALPVAGDFDNDDAGDEVGLFNGATWWLDTNGDNQLDTSFTGNMRGLPFAGDFDGDGLTDLGTHRASDDQFFFDLGFNGLNGNSDAGFTFGFPGVLERPFAGDFNLDGVDDIGLTTPSQSGSSGPLEWYILVSQGVPVVGTVNTLNHPFSPQPVGGDIAAFFGIGTQVPVVGNFDPPLDVPVEIPNIGGNYTFNGQITRVEQDGASLTFYNEHGHSSPGQFDAFGDVVATGWGGLTGVVSGDFANGQGQIQWANGTTWTYSPPTNSPTANPISGAYTSNGQATSVLRSGNGLVFINGNGEASRGKLLGGNTFVATDWGGMTGELVDGNLVWSNGSVWYDGISGEYSIDNKTAKVSQSGGSLTFTNENGHSSSGFFANATTVVATDWGNLTGEFINGEIQWSNGTSWLVPNVTGVTGEFSAHGGTANIARWGNTLVITNENGSTSRGFFTEENRLIASDWGGLSGVITEEGIQWSNGSRWNAEIEGEYNIGGQTASIAQVGNSLTFTNEFGGTSAGHFLNDNQVIATDWGGLVGTIVNDRIQWANGTVWEEKPGYASDDAIDELFASLADDWSFLLP